MDKELTALKLVLIAWPKIPPNAPEFIYPICLPKPKSSGFQCLHWAHWLGKINTRGNSKHQDPGYHFGPAS